MILWGNVFSGLMIVGIFWYSLLRFPLEFNLKYLLLSSLLLSSGVILGTYAKISLPFLGPETFEIKFDTLPVMFSGILLGPSWGILVGVMMDWIQLLVMPAAFPFLGFTLNLALTGFIAGMVFKSKHNPKSLINNSLFFMALTALTVIITVLLTNSYNSRLTLIDSHRWAIGLIMVMVLLITGLVYRQISGQTFTEERDVFMARFVYVVVFCELLIQWLLTSLWLRLMFGIPWLFLLIPRLIEAPLMVLIFVMIGRYLYHWVYRISTSKRWSL